MSDPTREAELMRVTAELDGLRQLVSVLAHDLSNPLQSLTVLLELALEDTDEPPTEKLTHCLGAAHRMRGMIRGLSDFARRGPQRGSSVPAAALVGLCCGVLERRFQRQEMALETDVPVELSLPDPDAARALQAGLLNALLSVVTAASGSGSARHALRVGGYAGGRLEVSAQCIGPDGDRTPLVIDEEQWGRISDSCRDSGVGVERDDSCIRFSWTEGGA